MTLNDAPQSVGLLLTSDQLVADYLTTRNTHNRQTNMPPVGFLPIIPATGRSQTYALRPGGHWDRQFVLSVVAIFNCVDCERPLAAMKKKRGQEPCPLY
jgi:hypothetical protein